LNEAWLVCGRRSGKSFILATIAVFLAAFTAWFWIGRFVSDKTKPESERYHPKWESHPLLILPDRLAARRPNKVATYFNSHSSTQVIGDLFIHILRSPMPNIIT
jgi:hypothetical protein